MKEEHVCYTCGSIYEKPIQSPWCPKCRRKGIASVLFRRPIIEHTEKKGDVNV